MNQKISIIAGIAVLLLAGVATAQGPEFVALYGSIKNGAAGAPVGTFIQPTAGVSDGIAVTIAGVYGGHNGGDKKLVINNVAAGTQIGFLVKTPTMNGFVTAQPSLTYDGGYTPNQKHDLIYSSVCGDSVCDSASESQISCSADCGSPPSTTVGGTGDTGGGGGSGSFTGNPQTQNPPVLPTQTVCTAGDNRCNGDNVEVCANNAWTFSEACANGCQAGQCITSQAAPAQAPPSTPAPAPSGGITGFLLANTPAIGLGILVVVAAASLTVARNRARKRTKIA